jgi:peptidyl-prolyl cis-trans isomerase C
MKSAAVEEGQRIIAPASVDSSPAKANCAGSRVRGVRRAPWLHEPLVQFLILGLALFLLNAALNHSASQAERSYKIALSSDDLRQLQNTFLAQWRRAPSRAEMQGLEETKIREEVLYREALMLGLDRDDVIVKRRLAQKMQFLAEDVAATHEPTTAELKTWYVKSSDRFTLPSRLSFRHLYFSPDRRGQRAHDDAMKALARIKAEPEQSMAAAGLADRFMFQDYYADRTPEELGKDFGPQFASAVPKLKSGSWQGPVESGYGWHLVFVDSAIPGRIPVFEEVEGDVRTAWLADQKQQALQKAYEGMRAKYTVLLPAPAEKPSATVPSKRKEMALPSGEGPL